MLMAYNVFAEDARSIPLLVEPLAKYTGKDTAHVTLSDTARHAHPFFWDGYTSIDSDTSVYLYQNYPNPFSGATVIVFQVVDPNLYGLEISVIVYSELGAQAEVLYDDFADDAIHSVTLDGAFFQSGFLMCVAHCGGHTSLRLMNLLH